MTDARESATPAAGARKAVAIGGGTGLPRVLRCMLRLGFEPTAIVTMADDGGSSGRLREELGILPPGDVRNCLVALAPEDNPLAHIFQYRFAGDGGLAGHALGNLVIAALSETEGGFAEAIAAASELLHVRGRVLPSTLEDVRLLGRGTRGDALAGQADIAASAHGVRSVSLWPASPAAYAPALEALADAEVVIVGPGSLYTSLIPNFLVGGMTEALRSSPAMKVYVCNVANQRGETAGMDAADHLRALCEHGLEGILDMVLVHDTGTYPIAGDSEAVMDGAAVRDALDAMGVGVCAADLADPADPLHHDPVRLASALATVLPSAAAVLS